LLQEEQKAEEKVYRKRKAKGVGELLAVPDLNNTDVGTLALVPSGLVKDRLSKMSGDHADGSKSAAELLKKQPFVPRL
jgi:hypothetical protein